MFDLKDYQDDLPLFTELGLMAIKQGDEESAKKLFNAVGLLEGSSSMAKKFGLGLIAIHKLDIADAQKHFGEIIKKEPKNSRAIAFMAFTHMLAVMEEGDDKKKLEHLKQSATLAKKANEMTDDASTKELAKSILDWEAELQNLEIV